MRIRCREARDTARGVRRSPGFSTAAIVILALGTALSAGMFTVLERLLLAPLPVTQPQALVSVGTQARGWPAQSYGFSDFYMIFSTRPGAPVPAEDIRARLAASTPEW